MRSPRVRDGPIWFRLDDFTLSTCVYNISPVSYDRRIPRNLPCFGTDVAIRAAQEERSL